MTDNTISGQCPHCQAEMTIERPEIIDADREPDIKATLLSGQFFTAHCPACDQDFIAATPLLYYDRRRTAVIQMVPGYDGESPLLGDDVFNALQTADSGQPVRMIRRVVTTPNELTEKIHLLEAGYDDRIVELAKLIALQELQGQLPNLSTLRQVRFAPKSEQYPARLLFFYDDEMPSIDFPQSLYDSVGMSFVEALEKNDPANDLVVDLAWAMSFLKRHHFIDRKEEDGTREDN